MATWIEGAVPVLLTRYAIGGLVPHPTTRQAAVAYRSGLGLIEFYIDTSGEVIGFGGIEFEAFIPPELSPYVAGQVSAEQQRDMLVGAFGTKRSYPVAFDRTLGFLKANVNIARVVQTIGALGKDEALRRLQEYRATSGDGF